MIMSLHRPWHLPEISVEHELCSPRNTSIVYLHSSSQTFMIDGESTNIRYVGVFIEKVGVFPRYTGSLSVALLER